MNRRKFLHGMMWGGGVSALIGAQVAVLKFRASRPKMEIPAVYVDPLGAPDRDVRTIAFSLTGNQLVSVAADRKVSIWDPATEKIIVEQLSPIRGGASDVSFFGDRGWLAAIEEETFLSIWNSGKEDKPELFRLDSPPKAVAFCPILTGPYRACTLVAVALEDHSVRVFERNTNGVGGTVNSGCCGGHISSNHEGFAPTQALRPNYGGATSLSFSRNGQFLAVGGHESVQIWHTRDWVRLIALAGHKGRIGGVAFSPDGSLLAAGMEDGSIAVWDWQKYSRTATLDGDGDGAADLVFCDGNDWIIAGYASGAIKMWPRRDTGIGLVVAKNLGKHTSIAISADGRYFASSWGKTVKFWNTSDLEAKARKEFG